MSTENTNTPNNGCCGGNKGKENSGCCGGNSHEHKHESGGCCGGQERVNEASGCCGDSSSKKDESNKGCGCSKNSPLPMIDFSTFILSLASTALLQLGEVPNPETGKIEEDLLLAKHSIDLLDMLHDKINNGLDASEKRLLDGLLYELRMKYVIKAK